MNILEMVPDNYFIPVSKMITLFHMNYTNKHSIIKRIFAMNNILPDRKERVDEILNLYRYELIEDNEFFILFNKIEDKNCTLNVLELEEETTVIFLREMGILERILKCSNFNYQDLNDKIKDNLGNDIKHCIVKNDCMLSVRLQKPL